MSRTALAVVAKKLPKTDQRWLMVALLFNDRSKTLTAYSRVLRRYPKSYDTISLPTMGKKLTGEEARKYFPCFYPDAEVETATSKLCAA